MSNDRDDNIPAASRQVKQAIELIEEARRSGRPLDQELATAILRNALDTLAGKKPH